MSTPFDPNRLHLKRVTGRSSTYLIVFKQRIVGQVESVPVRAIGGGMEEPPILLERPFSERLQDRIRDLVNKRDGTNRNIIVRSAPRRDHPAIIRYFEKRLSW
jgi:hypothetical protein